MGSPWMAFLSNAVKGYDQEREKQITDEFNQNVTLQKAQLDYLDHMATNENVPIEHRQWALQRGLELRQADPRKKLPKVDLGTLPPASISQPARQTVSQAPGMVLQPPVAPPTAPSTVGLLPPVGPGGATAATATPAPSSEVGRDSSGAVNALGAAPTGPSVNPATRAAGSKIIPPYVAGDVGPPNAPNTIVTGRDSAGRPTLGLNQPNFAVAPPSPVVIPPSAPSVIQNPTPPKQISAAGELHLLTPEEKAMSQDATVQALAQHIQARNPSLSNDEALYQAIHGEPSRVTLGPDTVQFIGGKPVNYGGDRTSARSGVAASGFKVVAGPGGNPVSVINLSTKEEMGIQEAMQDPKGKIALEDYRKGLSDRDQHEYDKWKRGEDAKQAAQQRQFAQQERLFRLRQGLLTNSTKTMIEAAPEVKKFIDRIRLELKTTSVGPLAGRWNNLWTTKAGLDNPDFARMRTDTGLLQTLLMRMHVGARGGSEMLEHFKEMIDAGKQSPDNMRAAMDEIEAYASDLEENGRAHGMTFPGGTGGAGAGAGSGAGTGAGTGLAQPEFPVRTPGPGVNTAPTSTPSTDKNGVTFYPSPK